MNAMQLVIYLLFYVTPYFAYESLYIF